MTCEQDNRLKLAGYLCVCDCIEIKTDTKKAQFISSFQQQNNEQKKTTITEKSNGLRTPFHLHEYSIPHSRNAAETAINNIAAKQPVTDHELCRYVEERRIDKKIAVMYCYNVTIKINYKDEAYTAIRFKKIVIGYEVKNDVLKHNSASKLWHPATMINKKTTLK